MHDINYGKLEKTTAEANGNVIAEKDQQAALGAPNMEVVDLS